MNRTILMGLIIAAIGTTIAAPGLIPAPRAFAQNNPPQNDFGEGAAGGCADPLGCGHHSSEQTEPRVGIGNVGEELLDCGHLTPAELARVLNGGGPPFNCDLAREP